MGGTNPYIKSAQPTRATQPVQIQFCGLGAQDAELIEFTPGSEGSGTGLPGSILDIALAHGIDIDHACGGVCACSTCHIIVEQGLESCNSSTEEEDDQLEKAPGLSPQSRLACQCVADGSKKLVVRIPNWNRNLVRE